MNQTIEERQQQRRMLAERVPVGIEGFAELADPIHQGIFVDRTPWLKDLLNERAKVVAFHTFRRSGKSLTASMIEHFFASAVEGQSTQGLFDRLALGQSDPEFVTDHQGQYPVIAFSLKDVPKKTYQETRSSFIAKISTVYRSHKILEHSTLLTDAEKRLYQAAVNGEFDGFYQPLTLENSLAQLSRLLYNHHGSEKKVFIIIDEYDAPLVAATNYGYLEDMTLFYRNFLTEALKTNPVLEKGILFGILRISKESLLSGLNNPQIYTLLNPGAYQPYFGFTEKEIKGLLNQLNLSDDVLTELKEWYNGYVVGDYDIYNPYSVMSYLKQGGGKPRSFWVNTSNDSLLKRCLLNADYEVKDQFRALMEGREYINVHLSEMVTFENLENDAGALWALMFATGYLTPAGPLEPVRAHYEGPLRIPNKEVLSLFLDIFTDWFIGQVVKRGATLEPFYKAIDRGNADALGQWLGNFLATHTSYHNLTQEDAYHSLLIGLTAGIFETHHVFSETEAGHGRADLMIVPRESYQKSHLAWIFEFKRPQKVPKDLSEDDAELLAKNLAKEALAQIDMKAYETFLTKFPHIKQTLRLGIGFVKKQVEWESILV